MTSVRRSKLHVALRGLGVVLLAVATAVALWRLSGDRIGMAALLLGGALVAAAAVEGRRAIARAERAREQAEEECRAFLTSEGQDPRTPQLRSILEQAGFPVSVVERDAGWFIVREPPGVSAEPMVELNLGALAALAPALRTELKDALVSLEMDRISGWIRHVAESDPALASALEQLAGRYQYTAILRALEACGGGAAKGSAV